MENMHTDVRVERVKMIEPHTYVVVEFDVRNRNQAHVPLTVHLHP